MHKTDVDKQKEREWKMTEQEFESNVLGLASKFHFECLLVKTDMFCRTCFEGGVVTLPGFQFMKSVIKNANKFQDKNALLGIWIQVALGPIGITQEDQQASMERVLAELEEIACGSSAVDSGVGPSVLAVDGRKAQN